MTIPDPITDIVNLLGEDADVIALVDDRIFGGGLKKSVTQDPAWPQPAVVVTPAGGRGRRGYELVRTNRVDTICYGATLLQSWQVYLAVREVLENLDRDGSLFWCEISSDGANALDPVELWPVCYASFTVMSAVTA